MTMRFSADLESITGLTIGLRIFAGSAFGERLKSYRRGIDLKIKWRAGAWQWIGHSWFESQGKPLFVGYGTGIEYGTDAHDARLFYADRKEFYRRGIGYFLRSRRMEKCRRQILPYKEPAWAKRKIEIKFGPASILPRPVGKAAEF